MVIYDTKNNNNGEAKGQLYLNVMDIDYIITKYGVNELRKLIPLDYAECFEDELDKVKKEDKLSLQYYSVLPIGIETDFDENLLGIIKNEIDDGNLFTKKFLSSLSEDELKQKVNEIKKLSSDFENLTSEYLYKLRSYKMAEFIFENISRIKQIEKMLYGEDYIGSNNSLFSEFKTRQENLIYVGTSADIYESDYFINKQKIKNF